MTAAHAIRCDQWSEVSTGLRAYEYRFTLPPADSGERNWRRNMKVMILAKTADAAHEEFRSRWPQAELTGIQLRSADMDVIVVGIES